MFRTILVLATLTVAGTTCASAGWVDANGKSCQKVCGGAGVTSGTYQNPDARLNGQKFHVCRGNAGDGWRPGYNLIPNWSSNCWVGFGGKETPLSGYQCLCK